MDMNRTGFLIPDSLYIRYRATVTSATTASELAGTPVFTPFQRQEVMIGSTVVETINQFNQVANILTNLTTSVASKYGLQSSYGYDGAGSLSTLANFDGRRIVAAGESYTVSAPLLCVLSSCEKLIPLFAIPTVRLTWTMDTLSEMFAVIGGVTNFTISNFELVYTVVTMDQSVEQMIRNQGTFYIKSQSFFNTASVLASGTNGTITIPFNVNFASIKSLLVSFSGISSVNKSFDSFDPTSSNGDLSVQVGGLTYP